MLLFVTSDAALFEAAWDAFCADENINMRGLFPRFREDLASYFDLDDWRYHLGTTTLSVFATKDEKWATITARNDHTFSLIVAGEEHIEICTLNKPHLFSLMTNLGLSPDNPIVGRSFIRFM